MGVYCMKYCMRAADGVARSIDRFGSYLYRPVDLAFNLFFSLGRFRSACIGRA